MNWKIPLGVLIVAGVTGVAYINHSTKPYVLGAVRAVKSLGSTTGSAALPQPSRGAPDSDEVPGRSAASREEDEPWNRLVPITPEQRRGIGLRTVPAEPQTQPIQLVLHGTTAYDEDTLTQIRPRFASLVRKVYKGIGAHIQRGDRLVDLYSNDLADAKSDFQTAYVQYLYWKNLRETREKLFKKGSITEVTFVETRNNERVKYLEYKVARDKLQVYGLTDDEIDPLLEGLTGESESFRKLSQGSVAEKAEMSLRSPTEGIIIKRDVVPGNLYNESSVLLVIAPLDHLRVYGNVYESDIDKIQVGQDLEIRFPFQDRSIPSKVQVISNQVDPETHSLRIRTTIKNPGGLLKADMLVRIAVNIPPVPGYTVIPRIAMVSSGGQNYVFVRKAPGAPRAGADHQPARAAGGPREETPELFERRPVRVAQEQSDRVIVREGIRPGEEVVTSGSLILAQMYEDLGTVDTGTPQ